MGEWTGGAFSNTGFATGGFNTGVYTEDDTMAPPDRETAAKFALYRQVQQEDEEILAVIISAFKSGILEK